MMRLLLTPLSLLLLPSCTHADFAAPSSLDSTIAHGMVSALEMVQLPYAVRMSTRGETTDQ